MKIIKVDCCLYCPYLAVYVGNACTCRNELTEGRRVDEFYSEKTLPNWCPLEDLNEIKKEEFVQAYLRAWNIPSDDLDEINEVSERARGICEEINKKEENHV